MLRPIGTLSMLRLILHGAMGTLGEAQNVEHFDFDHLVVRLTLAPGRRGVTLARLQQPDLLVACVNTTRAWQHKHGEVSARQIDRVARLLANATPAQLRVVVVHQPVAVTRAEDASNLLRGHAGALQPRAAARSSNGTFQLLDVLLFALR